MMELTDEELEIIIAHLEVCDICSAQVEAVPADDFVRCLQRAAGPQTEVFLPGIGMVYVAHTSNLFYEGDNS
jgi:hypothetical protein